MFLAESLCELKRRETEKQSSWQNVQEGQPGVVGEPGIEGCSWIGIATAESLRPEKNETAPSDRGSANQNKKAYGEPEQATG